MGAPLGPGRSADNCCSGWRVALKIHKFPLGIGTELLVGMPVKVDIGWGRGRLCGREQAKLLVGHG